MCKFKIYFIIYKTHRKTKFYLFYRYKKGQCKNRLRTIVPHRKLNLQNFQKNISVNKILHQFLDTICI